MNELIAIFLEFFKIGLFSIGGGLATIPFINDLVSTHPSWITHQDVANMIAISQSTPGPFGINMATFTGFKVFGLLGSITAVIALILPSIIIVIIVAKFLTRFNEKWYVKAGFASLRPTVLALIIYALSNIFVMSLFNKTHLKITEAIIFITIFFLSKKFNKVHLVLWIVLGAFLSIILDLPKGVSL